jgi:hypothetical protein
MDYIMILILSLISVESSGNDHAIGDGGKAFGCLQIHECVIIDVNEYNKWKGRPARYTHEDAFDREKAIEICKTYIERYIGLDAPYEDMARLWNSGPAFKRKKHLTDAYWGKVQKVLTKRGL